MTNRESLAVRNMLNALDEYVALLQPRKVNLRDLEAERREHDEAVRVAKIKLDLARHTVEFLAEGGE